MGNHDLAMAHFVGAIECNSEDHAANTHDEFDAMRAEPKLWSDHGYDSIHVHGRRFVPPHHSTFYI